MKKGGSAGTAELLGHEDLSSGFQSPAVFSNSNCATPAPSAGPSLNLSRASSAFASRPSSAAALAFQQASEAYHAALLQKRLELVAQMQAALTDTSTIAYQSIAAYSHCLEGVLTDVAFEVFEEGQHLQGNLQPQARDTETVLPLYQPTPQGMDVFGQIIPHAPTERVRCMHCDWEGAAARFAAHLDKCLSGGRNCRRVGRARN
ncbi:MAG: hypothetical protein FRX49_06122 [Trebouxia sp. A1-2]|nr:MAG: hypothetical protein FRX49_06122 [Trebouxia sp. A1-2]